MTTTESKALAPRGVLPQWANNNDGWVRTIVRDILKNKAKPSDLDIYNYLKLLLSEKKLSDEVFEAVPKIEEEETGGNPLESVRLDSIEVGGGVNALKPGTKITFAPGVTVIFGENGSGKSGFVRILKRAAGVRTAEDILPNIRSDTRPLPSGTFELTVSSESRAISWRNEFGVGPLNRIAVFDARGARIHAEDDLTYVYTPGELLLFPIVQNAIERVRAALETAIINRTPGPNTILASFDRCSSIYASIETLGAATDLEEIAKYAELPTGMDELIDSLRLEIDALKSTSAQNELKRYRERAAVVRALKEAFAIAKTFDIGKYSTFLQARDRESNRRDAAGAKVFEDFKSPVL